MIEKYCPISFAGGNFSKTCYLEECKFWDLLKNECKLVIILNKYIKKLEQ